MTNVTPFHDVLADLARQIGVNPQVITDAGKQVYSFAIEGKLDVNFVGIQEGFLNVWCFPALLPGHLQKDALLTLLSANVFSFSHPPISVGYDKASNRIMMWCRQSLMELDSVKVCHLFDHFIATAETLQQWIAKAAQSSQSNSNPLALPMTHRL